MPRANTGTGGTGGRQELIFGEEPRNIDRIVPAPPPGPEPATDSTVTVDRPTDSPPPRVETPRPRVAEGPSVTPSPTPARTTEPIQIDRAPKVQPPATEKPTPGPTPSAEGPVGPKPVETTRVEGPGLKPPVTDDDAEPAPAPAPSTEPAPAPEPTVTPPVDTAEEKRKQRARSLFREAIAAHRKRNLDTAAKLYEQAIAADPALIEAMVNLAGLRMLQNDYVAAEIYYRQAVGVAPKRTTALFGLGRVQLIRGNAADAHGTLGRLLTINPKDAAAWVLYGDASWGIGNKDEALQAWQTAADRAPEGPIKNAAGQRLAKYGGAE
jgi:Tfp pilus assembly protein PilF